MTTRGFSRPVLTLLAAGVLGGCELAGEAPDRFEIVAERMAAMPLDGARRPPGADAPLTVEVMTPHALWDARDGASPRPPPADRPLIEARDTGPDAAEVAVPAIATVPDARPAGAGLVQLGAYASEAAARAAWDRLAAGSAGWALDGLAPVLEPVEVDGRRLVRLKVRALGGGAAAICAAAGVDDPWCRQGG